jgi:NADH-quinone oxidoreductase subunit N
MISVLFKMLSIPFSSLIELWQPILVLVSAASLLIGSFSAANNIKIKRFLAYSSIAHVGFILNALSTLDNLSVAFSIFYVIIYIFLSLGIWSALLILEVGHLNKTPHIKYLTDLSGFGKTNKTIAAALAILLFSMSGIPPLAGFYSKFFVLVNSLEHSLIGLFVISLFASAVGAFYYLRTLKIIYFDQINTQIFFNKIEFYNCYIFSIIIGINLLFSLFPSIIFNNGFYIAYTLLLSA